MKIAIICIITSVVACKKSNEPSKLPFADNTIYAGYSAKMLTVSYDTTIYADSRFAQPSRTIFFPIDVDLDGLMDLEFESHIEITDELRYKDVYSKIIKLNDSISFLCYTSDDSIFTSYQEYELNENEFTKTTTYTCRNLPQFNTFDHLELGNLYLKSLEAGEAISGNDKFTNTDIIIRKTPITLNRKTTYLGDSIIFENEQYEGYCNQFPINRETYIGFKLEKKDRELLGWIRIRNFSINGIELISTGIQE